MRPRLRDSKKIQELYPLGSFPKELINKLGGYLIYLIRIGRSDVSGDDFQDAFARAIDGINYASPVGIVDVAKDKTGWSVKTVKDKNPFRKQKVRLVIARSSPDYSWGISNPREDIQKTGKAVLEIWNERVNVARTDHNFLRMTTLIRSHDLKSYVLFEKEIGKFNSEEYTWKVNGNGNFEAFDQNGNKRFVWQPHGSQLTYICDIPENAVKFEIRKPDIISQEEILNEAGFNEDWVKIL